MAFAEEYRKIEKYVQEDYTPFVKKLLEEAALNFLDSPYSKLTLCTELINCGYAIIHMNPKFDGVNIRFSSGTPVRILPPHAHYEYLSGVSPPVDFAVIFQKIFLDRGMRREIIDKAVKEFFTDFDVSFVDTPGEHMQVFRYKISKRV